VEDSVLLLSHCCFLFKRDRRSKFKIQLLSIKYCKCVFLKLGNLSIKIKHWINMTAALAL